MNDTNDKKPSFAIVGAGAVGGYYGARLAQHGFDVEFLLRSDYEFVRANGISVKSCDGDFDIKSTELHVHSDPGTMRKVDYAVVTLKTTANDHYDRLIRPLIKDNTAILTLQNGLGNEEQLASLFGANRILGGLAFTCINRMSPGVIHHLDHGLIRLGELIGGPSDRAKTLAAIFNSCKIHCQVLENLTAGRWEKLVWNVPFNGLGAALNLTTDKLIDNPAGERMVRALMGEVIKLAESINVRFSEKIIEQKIEQTRTMGAYKTSMQIDRESKRRMEVEAIFGHVVVKARELKIATPVLDSLHQMLLIADRA